MSSGVSMSSAAAQAERTALQADWYRRAHSFKVYLRASCALAYSPTLYIIGLIGFVVYYYFGNWPIVVLRALLMYASRVYRQHCDGAKVRVQGCYDIKMSIPFLL